MSLSLDRKSSPPHNIAKKLNNRAAFCIEAGQFHRAISNLVKAFKISSRVETIEATCSCKHCSLDECMAFTQKVPEFKRSLSSRSLSRESSEPCDGYVYRRPIQIKPQAMKEGHKMGLTLPLIITFNLALAHHLSAIEDQDFNRTKLKKVLQLYELAYRWQMDADDHQFTCIRFTMVISNNLGEIHRVVKNKSKHVKCLQHLLSTMMVMVDCHQSDDSLEYDGFLRNTSQLILIVQCAGAA